ncbi:MAG: Gldg family protein [Planctomycetota bacterium]|nr:Gldg family protein [Planctomycetota bacterium]
MTLVNVLTALSKLLVLDIVFLFVILAIIMTLSMTRRVGYAVLKRNFYGYFSNPTGYVFLCLFVLLTSMAAFWPHEFFSSNLGTLGQLNKWFTYIMLFFIPAITMSIWAEERRQGTDELLLTLPADDFDIVIGKYVAAASIYSVSLLFSQLSTFIVLAFLTQGEIDTGLFFTNYIGYWFIGLAMIAIGMVASFLTNNLTVGFILGALFNAPLAFAFKADTIADRSIAREIKNFSIPERFDDFGRGVLSLSGISYFVLVAMVGIYLCMVLIGKRHWTGGSDGNVKLGHYLLRIALLVGIAIGGTMLFRNKDRRLDATEMKVSSLSPVTADLIKAMGKDRDIVVDAYLSAEVPEEYAKIKYQVISLLKEFQSTAMANGVSMQLRIYDSVLPSSEEEKQAEQQYGILPQTIRVRERGTYSDQPVLLSAAFRSGLQKVVIPFFEPGVPVEYELIRSLTTVAKPARKKLGVLNTDARMMGGFDQRSMQSAQQQPIVQELSKQYEIVSVSAATPIDTEKLDVLLAVQPSSMSPEEMVNFTDAVKSGLPTAIFEDPMVALESMPGTGEPKQAGGPMAMFGGGGPQPKGDILPLWRALGLDIPRQPGPMGLQSPDLCWHEYNPYPVLAETSEATDLWVFAREEAPGADGAFSSESEISKGLKEVMFLYAGAIRAAPESERNVEVLPLVKTGAKAGTLSKSDLDLIERSGLSQATELRMRRGENAAEQILAVLVEGKPSAEKKEGERSIKAVYVADVDCLTRTFVDLRNRPPMLEEIKFQFQNITFVLNAIDVLAGETNYPQIRRHVPFFSTLRLVEEQADIARQEEATKRSEFSKNFNEAIAKAEEENSKAERDFKDRIEKLSKDGTLDASKFQDLQQLQIEAAMRQQNTAKRFKVEKDRLQRERDTGIRNARREADEAISKIQNYYKLLAVFVPPIPPLLVGIIVMVSRRLREREGISKNRLK